MKQLLLFLFFSLPFSVYSQLNESFDHTGVADLYPWEGTLEQFTVNQQGELQLYALGSAGSSYLAIASTRLYDNEWRCKVRSEYWCTVQNYFTIHLWCREPDMKDPGEAVFVRLGYTKKNIALCYQLGNNKAEVLFEGRVLFADPTEVEVKVVTDANGNCTLYAKGPTDDDYYKEGTVELPVADVSGYFMIGAVYSGTHSRDKYWDDIHVKQFTSGEEEPEGEEPGGEELLSITHLEHVDESTLHVWLDRPVAVESASFVLSDMGEVGEVGITEDGKVLELTWDAPLIKGQIYQLAYSGVLDESGQVHTGEYTFTATYEAQSDDPPVPDAVADGAVVINEVMADPKGLTALPETEYVELYNTTSSAISLDGWHFYYADNAITLPNQLLAANGYVVLYRTGRTVRIDEGGKELPLDKFPSQLANTGKTLQLTDATGKVIDLAVYEQAQPGVSWERMDAEWHLSSDERGGTPGSINSLPAVDPDPTPDPDPDPGLSPVEPGEIIFNELLAEPFSSASEYVELYNRSTQELPLDGLSIATRKSDGTLSTKYPLHTVGEVLMSEDHIVLTRSREGVASFYPFADPDGICEVKIPQLANTASTLVLFRAGDGIVIDEVAYSYHWHDSSIKDRKGVSLERIDPDKPTGEAENWTSATVSTGYGTPGVRNSQYKATDTDEPTGIEAPVYDRASGKYTLSYLFGQPGYTIRARIYDLSGRQVAVVANNEQMGTQGSITWNGAGSDGSRLMPGVYIFYAEAYHPDGEVKKGKKVFLVY